MRDRSLQNGPGFCVSEGRMPALLSMKNCVCVCLWGGGGYSQCVVRGSICDHTHPSRIEVTNKAKRGR
jgi:hypothetical protein